MWQRIIPNITSSSDSSSFVLLEIEYHSWNLFQKELACMQFINKCHRVRHSEGQKGQEGEATFFILCNKLFVGKIRWMIFQRIISMDLLTPFLVFQHHFTKLMQKLFYILLSQFAAHTADINFTWYYIINRKPQAHWLYERLPHRYSAGGRLFRLK